MSPVQAAAPVTALRSLPVPGFPFTDVDANRTWLAVVCFADALLRWFQQLCLTGALAIAEPEDAALGALARPGPDALTRVHRVPVPLIFWATPWTATMRRSWAMSPPGPPGRRRGPP